MTWQSCRTRDGRADFCHRLHILRPDGASAAAEMAFNDFDASCFGCFPDDPAWVLDGEATTAAALAAALPGLGEVLVPRPSPLALWP